MKILVIDSNISERSILVEAFAEHEVHVAADASEAITIANDHDDIALVVMEMLLNGHSGMEFLYEFRTYVDWQAIPVIVYSSLKLDETVLSSRSWEQLNIAEYLYKPNASLRSLMQSVERVVVV